MKINQLKSAIKSVLSKCNMTINEDIINMLIGTACVESNCGEYLYQLNGPAYGIFQMEPNTAKDIINNFINNKPQLKYCHDMLYLKGLTLEENLCYNIAYQIFMCRVFYLRFKEKIPSTLDEQAKYWKKYYNTYLGKGTIEQYKLKWSKYNV